MGMQTRLARFRSTGQGVEIGWSGTSIERIVPISGEGNESLPWLAAGFVDVQVNGLAGINFGNPMITPEEVSTVASRLAAHGVTHFLPTLITDSIDRMRSSLERLARSASVDGAVAGIHLEGPYLSSLDGPRGAHPVDHCKDPDWDEFCRLQEAASGKIRVVTMAPERRGALDFIRRAVDSGVRVAIGHTAATRAELLAAVDAGASLSTHLGNAAHDQVQRHHNYIFDQLGEDRLWASLIVDGHHLPPHLVKIFVRAKGIERIILVSDAVQYTGLPAGVYDAGYRQFEVREDGFIGVVGEPRLAGSGLLLTRAIENFTRYLGYPTPQEAIRCVTIQPRRWLTGRPVSEEPTVGDEASLVFYHWDEKGGRIDIRETIRAGQSVYRSVE
jgi:N-acetylglucosamine-6-phosphate deacetylase